ncbi:Dihydroanticapsin 7-dehydrogenase [Fulvia fulva]|uniref:Dihydroanticapsin 7-dehydrogenase n=1 Tax=Passalora fulva TaxID=5499 RepID=A0A9Q8PA67_PASFU|nr:Dihydroanticapsin 7-dehydrogenase [Fulvia fulva]KAK4622338.1 Dihydroanticapsin 7-dehydrogenase [Fulvia fulva]KAK4623256.1 Dihydroanticapsin 7-dehydrogenase [Fulvia fulva]UJO18718.1 Dihydroanticapsin 7-dehydrogenase [Fulvia fulva]WPV15803.1 Dihydroanticapsin 7-dehydrogenase [Fulvia fulva]WPV31137.1 Dihydroanticapsin 7-dehydrogenase [Fulvia fulva]
MSTHLTTPFSLGFGLEDSHVLITGGCGLIGRVVVDAFLAAGSRVSVLDLPEAINIFPISKIGNLRLYTCDISSTSSIDAAFTEAESHFGTVESCLAIASIDLSSLPQTDSICDSDPDVWRKIFDVNVHGTLLTAQRWLRGVKEAVKDPVKVATLRNISLTLIGSEAGTFGVRGMPAYAAGKSAVQYGLLQSLAKDVPRIFGKARVNAVVPGTVDTSRFREEVERYGEQWRWAESQATVGMGKAVPVEDVARMFLVLASERFGGSVHGQCVSVNGGKMGSLMWIPGEGLGRGVDWSVVGRVEGQ